MSVKDGVRGRVFRVGRGFTDSHQSSCARLELIMASERLFVQQRERRRDGTAEQLAMAMAMAMGMEKAVWMADRGCGCRCGRGVGVVEVMLQMLRALWKVQMLVT